MNTPLSFSDRFKNPLPVPQPDLLLEQNEPEIETPSVLGGIGAGAISAIDETFHSAGEVIEWVGKTTKMMDESTDINWKSFRRENINGLDWIDNDFGTAGNVAKSITKFGIGTVAFGAVGKIGLLGKASQAIGRTGSALLAGATADFVMTSEEEGLIADVLKETSLAGHSEAVDAILDYMSYDEENDSDLTLKLKASLEGAFLGTTMDIAVSSFKGIGKILSDHVEDADVLIKRSRVERLGGDPTKVSKGYIEGALTRRGYAEDLFEVNAMGSSRSKPNKGGIFKSDKPFRSKTWAKESADNLENLDADDLNVVLQVSPHEVAESMLTKGKYKAGDILDVLNRSGMWEDSVEVERVVDVFSKKLGDVIKGGDARAVKLAKAYDADLSTLQNEIAGGNAFALKQLIFRRRYDQMVDKIGFLVGKKTKLTSSENMQLRHELMLFAEHGTALRSFQGTAGRALRNNRRDVIELFDPMDGKTVKVNSKLQEEVAKRMKTAIKDDEAFGELTKEIKASGGNIGTYLDRAMKGAKQGEEYSKAMKWAYAYESYRHQNMLSAFSTGFINTVSTGVKVFTDQTLAPFIGGVQRGDVGQIQQALHSFTGFWQGAGGMAKRLADSVVENPKEFLDANSRKRYFDANRAITRVGREGTDFGANVGGKEVVKNSSAFLGFDDKWYGKMWDFMNSASSIPSSININIPDTLQSNGALVGYLNGRVAKDLVTNNMSKGDILAMQENVYQIVDRALKSTRGKTVVLPEGIPESHKAWFEDVVKFSKESVEEALFQQSTGAIAGLGRAVQNINHPAGKVFFSSIMPFVSTPLNIMNTMLEMTPVLGSLSRKVMDDLASGGARASQREAKMQIGATLYGSGAMLYMSGALTGSHPKGDRQAMQASGIPEHSIKIGDTWVQYTRMAPFGLFLGVMADTMQAMSVIDAKDVPSATWTLINGIGELTANQTYLRGIGDMYIALTDPERDQGRFMKNWATTLVPMSSGARWLNNVSDPVLRDSLTFIDKLKAVTPLKGKTREAQLDAFGYQREERSLAGAIFGIRTQRDHNSNVETEVLREMASVGAYPQDREGKLNGVKLTEEEAREAKLHMRGRDAYGQLERMVNSGRYQSAGLGQRKKLLSSLISSIKVKSRQDVLYNNVEARARHRDVLKEIREKSRERSSRNSNHIHSVLRQRMNMKVQ